MSLQRGSFMHTLIEEYLELGRMVELPNSAKINTSSGTYPISLPNVQVKLHNRDLWEQFYENTTEMIITKVGRRMFPHLQLDISGLEDNLNYCIFVEMEPASLHRHKYCGSNMLDENGNKSGNSGGWTKAGQAESQPTIEQRIYMHPESPARGIHWTKHVVNFNKLKISNSPEHRSNVLLTSMHKYIPRFWIFQSDHPDHFTKLLYSPHSSFIFKETEFIAVTAYQNEKITKLKINNNPFAKGFRETGQSRQLRCKRKRGEESTDYPSDEDNNSSFETSPIHRTTAMLLRTDILRNDINTSAVDGVKLSSLIVPVQDLTFRAEDNHLNARPPTPLPSYTFHRPWLNQVKSKVPPPLEVHLPSPSLSSLTSPEMPMYNFQFTSPDLLSHSFAPSIHSQYYPFVYPNIRNWHGTLYHMPYGYQTQYLN